MLAKSASDTPRISGGKAGSTSILRPFFFAAWVRITRASALRRKTGASKSGLCRFFHHRCAGCRIDSGSAAFKKMALAPEKRLQPWLFKAYLSPLMAQGYIAQTLPKKPKSPLQRYRLLRKGKAVLA